MDRHENLRSINFCSIIREKRQVFTMCLILFAYKVHPEYELIVAANRDEFYKRPASPVDFWQDEPDILAGRDLEKMGTWMGVTRTGRFAALTNYRNPAGDISGKRTRGEITTGALTYKGSMLDYLNQLAQKDHLYTGYNLLAGDIDRLYYYSNITGSIQMLAPGIYGLSNALLNTEWPKVQTGKKGLQKILAGRSRDLAESLFDLLRVDEQAPDHLLPKTGVSLEWERVLSPIFIKSDVYGTRSSTVLLMSGQSLYLQERTFTGDGVIKREFSLNL